MNWWIVWRPGDVREAERANRCACAVRGAAMIGPAAVFAVAPDSMPIYAVIAIVIGGLILSFGVHSLIERHDRE